MKAIDHAARAARATRAWHRYQCYAACAIKSSSTAAFLGSCNTPTEVRVCRPASPSTATNISEASSATSLCWVNSAVPRAFVHTDVGFHDDRRFHRGVKPRMKIEESTWTRKGRKGQFICIPTHSTRRVPDQGLCHTPLNIGRAAHCSIHPVKNCLLNNCGWCELRRDAAPSFAGLESYRE